MTERNEMTKLICKVLCFILYLLLREIRVKRGYDSDMLSLLESKSVLYLLLFLYGLYLQYEPGGL